MHVLCASIAPDYARLRDDFSAVMLLPEETRGAGGNVSKGHRGASGAEGGAGQARRGRGHDGSGRKGPRPQRATWGQRRPTQTGHRRRDRRVQATGTWGPSSGRATEATEAAQTLSPPHPSPPHPFAGGHTAILR